MLLFNPFPTLPNLGPKTIHSNHKASGISTYLVLFEILCIKKDFKNATKRIPLFCRKNKI